MSGQRLGARRDAVRGEVRGAGAHNPPYRADPRRDAAAVRQFGNPHRDIDLFFQEVYDAVGQHHANVDVRIHLEEVHDHRQDMLASEYDGRGDDELAPWHSIFPRCGTLRLAHVFENAAAGRDICLPGFGK